MSSLLRAISFFLISLLWVACGAPTLSGGVFRHGDVAFRLGPIPPSWQELETDANGLAALAFRDTDAQATIGAAGRCRRDGDDVPLRALTQHLHLGFTDRQITREQELSLDGRAALRTEMFASLDGVQKHLTFVVLKKDGCVYDFWHIADDKQDTSRFDAFVGGFHAIE